MTADNPGRSDSFLTEIDKNEQYKENGGHEVPQTVYRGDVPNAQERRYQELSYRYTLAPAYNSSVAVQQYAAELDEELHETQADKNQQHTASVSPRGNRVACRLSIQTDCGQDYDQT